MKRLPSLLGATGVAVALCTVSCTTIGTHVKGGFACRAPIGTCAPMSNIDAEAIAGLGGSNGSAMPIATDGQDGQARFITTSGEGEPVRTGERVMRVVFPAHADGHGIYHEEAVAHLVSERSAWTFRPAEAPDAGSLDAAVAKGSSSSERASTPMAAITTPGSVATAAPLNLREAAAGLAAPADPLPDEHDQAAVDMPGDTGEMPSAAAIEAARAGHRIGDGPETSSTRHAQTRRAAFHSRHRGSAGRKIASSAPASLTAALNRAALGKLAPVASHAPSVAVASASIPAGGAVGPEARP